MLPTSTTLTATTQPVSTDDVDEYIEDASAQMAGALQSAGINPDDIDDDTTRQIQEAIKAYAGARVMDALGATGQKYQTWQRRWEETYGRYSERPQLLSKRVDRIHHNVDTSDEATDAGFVGRGYKY